jgi:choline monooxygenase
LEIHERIGEARNLPGAVYADPAWFDLQRERLFPRAWLWAGDAQDVRAPGQVHPFTLRGGGLEEPLLLVRDEDDALRCLSNVCTHRACPVVEGPGRHKVLRCPYHGRRFRLDGQLAGMPEFQGVEGFPSDDDHLAQVPLGALDRFLFASLDPLAPFDQVAGPIRERLGWVPLGDFAFDPASARSYLVQANWALYVDNYLEGFHIPYVHPGLAQALDYSRYTTETFAWCNLQVGIAADGEPAFDLPAGHPDADRRIAGYYWWIFPGTMLNLYPWGLSVNLIEPLAVDRTRVRYLTYVWDEAKRGAGAGGALDLVEREDQVIVEACQRGARARLQRPGRYSPAREGCVHHFHRLLARALNDPV